MFNRYNRDILLVSSKALNNEVLFNQEVEMLKEMLYTVEDLQSIAISTEIYDLNRYQIIRKKEKIVQVLCKKSPRPFVFISNSN